MGSTACTEPQRLYKGALYLAFFYLKLLLETNIIKYSWIISRVEIIVTDPDDIVCMQNAVFFVSDYSPANRAVYDSFYRRV